MSLTRVFVPFLEKGSKQDDGTIIVRGIATDPSLDSDEQVCDPAWLAKAMPAWFQWGNVREQHSNIAAGVATEHTVKGDEHHIAVRVVDPGSVKKVETGVLKGFSIGIANPRITSDKAAAGGRIVDGEIVEVSLVDRPANPACRLTMAKSAVAGMEVAPEDFDEATGLVRVEELDEDPAGVDDQGTGDQVDEHDDDQVDEHDDEPAGDGEKAAGLDEAAIADVVAKAIAKAQRKAAKKAAKTADKAAGDTPADGDTPSEPTNAEIMAAVTTLGKRIKHLEKSLVRTAPDESTAQVVKALTTRLETVEQTAATLPVRTAVKQGARSADDRRQVLLAKAAEYEAKAAAEPATSTLAQGYRMLADEHRAQAENL